MAELKNEVQDLLKQLKSLTKQAEKLARKADRAKVAKPKKAPQAKKQKVELAGKTATTATNTTRVPASDVVYQVIKRSKKGIDTPKLIAATGYKEKKIRDIIYRLKNQNKIKSAEKGIYVALD